MTARSRPPRCPFSHVAATSGGTGVAAQPMVVFTITSKRIAGARRMVERRWPMIIGGDGRGGRCDMRQIVRTRAFGQYGETRLAESAEAKNRWDRSSVLGLRSSRFQERRGRREL